MNYKNNLFINRKIKPKKSLTSLAFKSIMFKFIPRMDNVMADFVAKQALLL